MAWVYVLGCGDGTFYVGSCRDLETRLAQHCCGRGCAYTAHRQPVRLLWAEEFERVDDAWVAERRLHGWSRAKKQALADGRFADLRLLSRNHSQHGRPEVDP